MIRLLEDLNHIGKVLAPFGVDLQANYNSFIPLDVKETEYIFGITEKMQNTLREKNILQCTQLVENGKVLYEVKYLEEFMKNYTSIR